ncbi:MAG TPA: ELM1/GtrOC1 family putative glycosyltransferase [Planctomycetaceae bacterium]|nr:ELM1/GtrOC1 family putative glycosyltransferase [Planctomycetaceae bacterium]
MPQSKETTDAPAVIWRFRDGRAGHENQVEGLSEAIASICPAQFCDIYLNRSFRGMKSLIPNRLSFAKNLPAPDLLIGAGHATHLPLLTFQKRFGGKTVVIMKPSLPTALFDLCLIPVHDNLMFQPGNVIRTEGSLNKIHPSTRHDSRQGIVLLGGPSRHFAWSDECVMAQILRITQKDCLQWTLATSHRTPQSFVQEWHRQVSEIPLVTSQECSPQWVPQQLANCGVAWVSCDSMSMIYEALTAGTRLGLLELPTMTQDRISRNIKRLTHQGLATTYSQWLAGHELPIYGNHLTETDRCALIVVERCLNSGGELLRRKAVADYRPGLAW